MKRTALFLVLSLVFLEWLDFSLYLYLAKVVFANEFFPVSANSLMLTFALFAAGYLARPFGGWLFGRQADLTGRRKPMVFSAALMGLATIGICVLPGYAQIGLLATWGLLVLRIAQGLALGGEINTSAMFLVEHHSHNPLIAGSFAAISGALGMFVGGVLAALVQYTTVSWTWRVVFAVVGGLSLWVCRKRKQLQESPEFRYEPVQKGFAVWRLHWRGLLNIATVGVYVSVTVYICNVFWVSFAIDTQLWSSVQCTWTGSFAQLASALLALIIARFAKREWNSYLLQASMLTTAFSAPMLFYFTSQNLAYMVLLSLLGYVLANALICSSLFYFLYLQLPPHCRCRGVSTIWALAASVGAFSLPFAQQMVTFAHYYWFPGLWVSIIAMMALASLRLNHPFQNNLSSPRFRTGAYFASFFTRQDEP